MESPTPTPPLPSSTPLTVVDGDDILPQLDDVFRDVFGIVEADRLEANAAQLEAQASALRFDAKRMRVRVAELRALAAPGLEISPLSEARKATTILQIVRVLKLRVEDIKRELRLLSVAGVAIAETSVPPTTEPPARTKGDYNAKRRKYNGHKQELAIWLGHEVTRLNDALVREKAIVEAAKLKRR